MFVGNSAAASLTQKLQTLHVPLGFLIVQMIIMADHGAIAMAQPCRHHGKRT